MVALKKITEEIFDDVFEKYLVDDDPYLGKEDWLRLFTLSPNQDEDYSGYALIDGNDIVGMLGMFFSKRSIKSQTQRFCNLHSWFVDEEYRSHSLSLMRPAIKLKDHTLTDFTPTDKVCDISKKLGFKEVDARVKILSPFSSSKGKSSLNVLENPIDIASRLSDVDARLLQDHQSDTFGSLLLEDKGEYCYVIFTQVERHIVPYSYIHYISNKSMFEQYEQAIKRHLTKNSKSKYVAVNSRLVQGLNLPWSFTLPVSTTQLFRSKDLSPTDIDSLYTEVSLLKLATYPSIKHSIKKIVMNPYKTLIG
ncbi:MAG: hypothetical protein COA78_13505 [Blastopirellula sp.]|nr:MAG: hypothetical protein COA78_13505 [Blastopirellula sp.]